MNRGRHLNLLHIMILGILIIALILIGSTVWMVRSAGRSTGKAVHEVSLMYMDELAGRREQVVIGNLHSSVSTLETAVNMMTSEDLDSPEHLRAFQRRMKTLFTLENFAFADADGWIYTADDGMEFNGGKALYPIDFSGITGPTVEVKDPHGAEKKVIISIPLTGRESPLVFQGKVFVACFMQQDMSLMLQGASIEQNADANTFCNLYTSDGTPLTDTVLGGLAVEDNLLDALYNARFDADSSLEQIRDDFASHTRGVSTFSYDSADQGPVQETLAYIPVSDDTIRTDWLLTYLIRESAVSEKISPVSREIILRSVLQSLLTALVLLGMFSVIISQVRKANRLRLEKETAETENRVKQQELEERLSLQEQLLQEEKQQAQLDSMITAMASDYRSVYYIDLDADDGICFRNDPYVAGAMAPGQHFSFREAFTSYAHQNVAPRYLDSFLSFIDPDSIRRGLESTPLLMLRYAVVRDGQETYEMLRMADAHRGTDQGSRAVHAIGAGFTDIDEEMRETMARNQALSDALAVAKEANQAKTAFLSNISHEIRTPMNAIIGLNSIALNDPDLSDKTRDYLKKIDGSAQHLLTLINDILDMSRIESGRMTLRNEEFSFSRLLEQVNTLFASQCSEIGLDYRCTAEGSLDDAYIGDSMKLRQVLINILSNAVKFTPEGGKVSLTVKRTGQFDGKSALRFVIADTGIGMSEEFLPRLFDAFSQEDSSTTSKYGSSGLGMAITKNIVEMMNGTIEVKSKKGEGTVFTVTVTLMDTARPQDGQEDQEIRPQELNVLVIDDDPIACEHAKLVLEKVGFSAQTVLSGAEAVEMVRIRHARQEPYQLILVDWKMPEMDGLETTRRIREIVGYESAIIILTAYRWDEILEEAEKAGVDRFIAKPLFPASVMEEFREALKNKNVLRPAEQKKADLKGRRILLAEDVPINAEIITMVLNMREMEVDHAENGRIALEKVAGHPAGYYDAVLMDMRMPEMDGLEATSRIRALDREDVKDLPIIALTANAFDEDVQRSLEAGLNAHLSKPVEPAVLYETLETLIRP